MDKNLEVLVATMNLKDPKELERKMNIKGKSLIINQITTEDCIEFNELKDENRVLSFKEKGLSRSRNKAVENSIGDICVIADDDLNYKDDYKQTIIKAYEKYKDADIIAFYVESLTEDRPTTMQEEGRVGYLKSMKIASFQITFKKASIINKNIKFDVNFGAGSGKYNMGEENIFLFDCLKKGLKIYFVQDTIASVKHEDSTWFKGFTEQYFVAKSKAFKRMSKTLWIPFVLQFAVRKYNLYKAEIGFWKALKTMLFIKSE